MIITGVHYLLQNSNTSTSYPLRKVPLLFIPTCTSALSSELLPAATFNACARLVQIACTAAYNCQDMPNMMRSSEGSSPLRRTPQESSLHRVDSELVVGVDSREAAGDLIVRGDKWGARGAGGRCTHRTTFSTRCRTRRPRRHRGAEARSPARGWRGYPCHPSPPRCSPARRPRRRRWTGRLGAGRGQNSTWDEHGAGTRTWWGRTRERLILSAAAA